MFEANELSLKLPLLRFLNCRPKTFFELHLLLQIDQTRYSKRHVLCAASFAEHKATQSHIGQESTRKKCNKQPFVCPARLCSKSVFEKKLATFGQTHPNTMAYLKAIPPERWVKYAQVKASLYVKVPTAIQWSFLMYV